MYDARLLLQCRFRLNVRRQLLQSVKRDNNTEGKKANQCHRNDEKIMQFYPPRAYEGRGKSQEGKNDRKLEARRYVTGRPHRHGETIVANRTRLMLREMTALPGNPSATNLMARSVRSEPGVPRASSLCFLSFGESLSTRHIIGA